MGAKAEAFAKEFEAKVDEATAILENLSDADWKRTTAAEKWTVAATAHHVASSYEAITRIIKTIASGQPMAHFTREMLDEMNAQQARPSADCPKAETIALHRNGEADAAAETLAARDYGARAERARRWLGRIAALPGGPEQTTYTLPVTELRLGDAVWVTSGG